MDSQRLGAEEERRLGVADWQRRGAAEERAMIDRQAAKQDAGKPRLSLVPSQIIWDIAQVREYGNVKYHDPDNWRTVELERYIDALYRHFLRFLDDPKGKDEESGLEHYKHMACNMAFICAMLAQGKEE